ncbi:MAG: type II toxin-antitoxin system VapC family toxin [Candidatus Devosia phytovorans]|uniref:Ribonuclease VapC n=1 Tax=Candidatus Devosia phytovorans TaxID=3121372 RepID=A0AAJ6B1S6_9HYPH|nr:type II toxin-antitoxin system VapC family toxin [Devosia sp.]WEK06607.1 MAG: type II toxin-antitoxin system VapC family toxin [Devosia sp.]
MILADTSIWIDHFRVTNLAVVRAIRERTLVIHPYVIGELALGSLKSRDQTIARLSRFHHLPKVPHDDILKMIETLSLYGRGLGYVDVHLLASCIATANCKLLTRDRRLRETAEQLGIAV